MSQHKKDFFGKEVAEAIKNACDELQVAQENLDIEVIETGSTGIFGLIRKKAHIRVTPKALEENEEPEEVKIAPKPPAEKKERPKKAVKKKVVHEEKKEQPVVQKKESEQPVEKSAPADEVPEVKELQPEEIEAIRVDLSNTLELMGYPSEVTITAEGTSVQCQIETEEEEILIGQDGKILDSLQYLLRKMIARKIPERLRLSVDVGNYRERRREDLKVRAVELATLVKEDGKTQVIPALSPSERRVVHMVLQEDKEIRSRSVGDGLFKKILIYKPGKGKKSGGKKPPHSHGRRGNGQRRKKE